MTHSDPFYDPFPRNGRGVVKKKKNRTKPQRRRKMRQYLYDTYGDGRSAPCFNCGITLTNINITIDRIIPGALGGKYTKDNIQPACVTCNGEKADRYDA